MPAHPVPFGSGKLVAATRFETKSRSPATLSRAGLLGGPSCHCVASGKKSRQRPTLPHGFPCSTIGSDELNFRVRDGIGCSLVDITTGNCRIDPASDCCVLCARERRDTFLVASRFAIPIPGASALVFVLTDILSYAFFDAALEVWSSRTTD